MDIDALSIRNTARTYYAAGTFFDILSQFGELEEDVSGESGGIATCEIRAFVAAFGEAKILQISCSNDS